MEEYEKNFNTEKFIAEIKQRSPLWDVALHEYTDRDIRKKLWDEVTNAMCDTDASDDFKKELNKVLQQKWRNLRSSFSRELRSRTTITSSGKKKPYVYFEHLQFLLHSLLYKTQAKVDTGQEGDGFKPKKQKTGDELQSWEEMNTIKGCIGVQEERKRELDKDEKFVLSLIDDFKRIPDEKKATVRAEMERLIQEALKKKKNGNKNAQSKEIIETEVEKVGDNLEVPYEFLFLPPVSNYNEEGNIPEVTAVASEYVDYVSAADIVYPDAKVLLDNIFMQTPESDISTDFDPVEFIATHEVELNPNEF